MINLNINILILLILFNKKYIIFNSENIFKIKKYNI